MSAGTSTEFSFSQDNQDKSNITSNSKLILENSPSDVTIGKYEANSTFKSLPPVTNSSLTMKTQVLPFVYIPNTKATSNVFVINTNNTTTSAPVNLTLNQQNVILATARPQSLLLQKPQAGTVIPVSVSGGAKIAGTYLTMLKPLGQANDTPQVNKFQVAGNALTEFPILNNNTYIQPPNNAQKIVIAPMPKMTTNRLPATATTNSVQPKIALLPMPVPSSDQVLTKYNVYQKLPENECSNVMNNQSLSNESSTDNMDSNSGSLVCDEVLDLDSPIKNDTSNKTYELSITEDSVSSQGELNNSLFISTTVPNEQYKLPKHGVSILKKTCNNIDKIEKPDNNDSPVENNGNVSRKNSTDDNSIIITIPMKNEKERRRKSNFSYRKEFDDIEITTTNNFKEIINDKSSAETDDPRKKLTSEIEIELIKEKPADVTNGDLDIQKTLNWDDGIGTLQGSNLKFIMNEFNMLEYITDDEYKDIVEKRMAKAKEKMKTEMEEEMRCLECGCYGLPADFISPKYCSFDCKEANLNKRRKDIKTNEKYKKKKRKNRIENETIKIEPKVEPKEEIISEEDSTDNNSFQDNKFNTRPWACKKKGFSWSKYLEHIKAKSAPVKLFKDPFPYNRNGFRPGMKLEGVDPQHPSYFCVLTVAEVVGYRLRLHFDGYPDNYDFWCNADSMDIFPMGWCEKHNHVLQPPAGYTIENFNWVQYLRLTKSTAAPKHLFANRAGQAICPNGFRIGMKLEAVDRKNTSLVCVATVRDMMDNRILVHFDSWDDIYDYWADPTSPYIHPVGWCDQYGHNLTPPNDYPNPETFSWEKYLKETKSVAVPVRAFKQRAACGFKRGMRLECVDKRVPQLIRVATVDDVKDHEIRIRFDGWLDRYSYWVDDDSPDIHPVGWCQKTGHPLEPPLTPDDVYDFMECRTVGCKGIGHIKGPRFATHNSPKHCPYAEENVDLEKLLPDRLLSPDRSPEEVVPVSREPKECRIKPRVGRPPKYPKLEQPIKLEIPEEPPEKKHKPELVAKPVPNSQEQKAFDLINDATVYPAERFSWKKHAKFLKRYTTTCFDPRCWTYRDVFEFVSNIECCKKYRDIFKYHKIDGEAFLLLNQRDIIKILKLKVGPAIKLYNSIVLLRQQISEGMYS